MVLIPGIQQQLQLMNIRLHNINASRMNEKCTVDTPLQPIQSEVGANIGMVMNGFPATRAGLENWTVAEINNFAAFYGADFGNGLIFSRKINLLNFIGTTNISN